PRTDRQARRAVYASTDTTDCCRQPWSSPRPASSGAGRAVAVADGAMPAAVGWAAPAVGEAGNSRRGGAPPGAQPLAGEEVWTCPIAIDPSPTAGATRLTEACRTSPAASTPGMLVSSENGRGGGGRGGGGGGARHLGGT